MIIELVQLDVRDASGILHTFTRRGWFFSGPAQYLPDVDRLIPNWKSFAAFSWYEIGDDGLKQRTAACGMYRA